MTAITFDTHKFVTKLKHSGINEKHAEAISDALRDAQAEMEIATKKDLRDLEHRLNNKFNALEYKIISKLGGLIIIMAALVAFFQKAH